MNSAEYPSLPSLAGCHAQLAADAMRVEQLVDAHLDEVERLFRAAAAGDWDAVAKLARQLAARPADPEQAEVVVAAKALARDFRRDRPTRAAEAHLNQLLQACRSLKERQRGERRGPSGVAG
ncbi:MAG: hypothetical protein KF847_18440 [Pirellulales bacterium]|nr:hypothetical protein [Pirellulales bacterium]